jgi:hypothetical protein
MSWETCTGLRSSLAIEEVSESGSSDQFESLSSSIISFAFVSAVGYDVEKS